ncbi:hypothetical protein TWF730_007056 [Orbilia blumenaviensis]|uniref:Uncharacterized protein n=1 Tax=Orbilia blumenaviensis TaxID=1796055 RepID=A0AAV9VIE1_9PEZI
MPSMPQLWDKAVAAVKLASRLTTNPALPFGVGVGSAWILPMIPQFQLVSLLLWFVWLVCVGLLLARFHGPVFGNKLHTAFYSAVTLGSVYFIGSYFKFPDAFNLYLPLLLSLGAFLAQMALHAVLYLIGVLSRECGIDDYDDLEENPGSA